MVDQKRRTSAEHSNNNVTCRDENSSGQSNSDSDNESILSVSLNKDQGPEAVEGPEVQQE